MTRAQPPHSADQNCSDLSGLGKTGPGTVGRHRGGEFDSPLVRELVWSCFQSTLLPGLQLCHKRPASTPDQEPDCPAPNFNLNPQRRQWLQQLDRDDTPLRSYLARHCTSPRLGLRFESLWHFFLQQDSDTELLAHNLPVRDKGRSVGEFDVLYRCRRSGRVIHLELAVKFYLWTPGLSTAEPYTGWLGPNQADRLERKLLRLRQHQLRLAQTPAGRDTLEHLDITVEQRQLQVSGRVFQHRDHPPPDNSHFSPGYPRGEWLTLAEFVARHCNGPWRYLAKPDWLDADYRRTQPLEQGLALAKQRPVMLIRSDQQANQQAGQQECQPVCMVVPDSWPASARCLVPE